MFPPLNDEAYCSVKELTTLQEELKRHVKESVDIAFRGSHKHPEDLLQALTKTLITDHTILRWLATWSRRGKRFEGRRREIFQRNLAKATIHEIRERLRVHEYSELDDDDIPSHPVQHRPDSTQSSIRDEDFWPELKDWADRSASQSAAHYETRTFDEDFLVTPAEFVTQVILAKRLSKIIDRQLDVKKIDACLEDACADIWVADTHAFVATHACAAHVYRDDAERHHLHYVIDHLERKIFDDPEFHPMWNKYTSNGTQRVYIDDFHTTLFALLKAAMEQRRSAFEARMISYKNQQEAEECLETTWDAGLTEKRHQATILHQTLHCWIKNADQYCWAGLYDRLSHRGMNHSRAPPNAPSQKQATTLGRALSMLWSPK